MSQLVISRVRENTWSPSLLAPPFVQCFSWVTKFLRLHLLPCPAKALVLSLSPSFEKKAVPTELLVCLCLSLKSNLTFKFCFKRTCWGPEAKGHLIKNRLEAIISEVQWFFLNPPPLSTFSLSESWPVFLWFLNQQIKKNSLTAPLPSSTK